MEIKIQLKRKHFLKSNYTSNTECSLAEAIKKQLNPDYVYVMTSTATINSEVFLIVGRYDPEDYHADLEESLEGGDSEEIIREVILKN